MPNKTDSRTLKEKVKAASRAIARHHAARDLKRKAKAKSNVVPIREQGIIDL